MTKKNEKRLCWNCEGNISYHLSQCPYCGVDLSQPTSGEGTSHFKGFASPFQKAPTQDIPQPPYASQNTTVDMSVSDDEWNRALNQGNEKKEEEDPSLATKKETTALLLLLPGVVFFLFGLALTLFSTNGVLSLQWNQNLAYFYFLGATPLLYLGWRAFRR